MAEGEHKVEDLTAQDVAKGIAEGRYLLIDVREPNEVSAEAYPDAVVLPLSGFDPKRHSRSEGQGGRVRLPVRPPLGDRVARGASRGLALRQAPRRRHPRLEGRGPADQTGG